MADWWLRLLPAIASVAARDYAAPVPLPVRMVSFTAKGPTANLAAPVPHSQFPPR